MTSILMLSWCNWQVKLIVIAVNNSYKIMVYVYIYLKSQKPRWCNLTKNKILGCVQFCDYMEAII